MQQFNLIRKRIIKIVIRLACLFLVLYILYDAFWLFRIDNIDIDQINAEYHTKIKDDQYFMSGVHRGLLIFKDEPTYTFTKVIPGNVIFINITHNDHVAEFPLKFNQPELYKSEGWKYKDLSINADILIHENNILNDSEYVPFKIEYSFHYLDTFYFIEKTRFSSDSSPIRSLDSGVLPYEKKEVENLIDEIVDF